MVNGHNIAPSLNFLCSHSLSAHSENLLAHSGVSVYEWFCQPWFEQQTGIKKAKAPQALLPELSKTLIEIEV